MTVSRRLLVMFGVLILATALLADEAVVRRNVHLRKKPSTSSPSLRKLEPPEEVEILDPEPKDGFLHVEAEDGLQGWVWSRFVRAQAPAEQLLPEAAATQTDAADAVSPSWKKPDPVTGTFTVDGVTCGPSGSGDKRDVGTNLRKNRTDIPPTYHPVTWKALATLDYPKPAPKSRENFDEDQLAEITRFEGAAVSAVGYIVAIKPQRSNSESCNCAMKGEDATDWHIALVEHPGDGESSSVVVEPTPRIKKKHPNWTKKNLEPWLNEDIPVRISGWLLFDPQHTNHLKKYRSTLWEIHPITKIEVWNDDTDQWENADNLPIKVAED
jgi:hypothetical protein